MNERGYRIALVAALSLCALLAGGLGYLALQRYRPAPVAENADPVVARGPAAGAPAASPAAVTPPDAEPVLAPVQLSPERMQAIGVTTAVVELRNVTDELHVPGNVEIDEQRLSYVQTRFPGWIKNVFANATYQYVSKGQRLFTIYSPDLVSTEQEYLLAKQNEKAFSTTMHGTAAQESGWLLQAVEERLRQYDVPAAAITALEQSGKVEHEITVESPASGYITERNALPNAYIQPDTKLYTIADLSTVWVYANVPQNAVGRLKPGNGALVTVDAFPDRRFSGRIDQILPEVDPATRTVRVRLIFRNPGVALKPGMYVDVDISVPLGRQLVIPASGVLQAGSRAIAFIDHGQGSLEPREVEVGPQLDDSVVVLKGLQAGDRVVSSANFLVDSEAQLQAELGTGAGSDSGLGTPPTPSSDDTAQQQMQVALSTEPSPPHKGANAVRVKLMGPDGKPVIGAQVSATFYMPAMPAMGMAPMRAVATLVDKGEGLYEGQLELGSGGTWQVTVTVIRNGQRVATKQLSVSNAGGM
jgi:Cu(I)/Ag(I) efflux system membrane fusion protein/cobalt-zinc-cadmium efflux system membrane fusion protein